MAFSNHISKEHPNEKDEDGGEDNPYKCAFCPHKNFSGAQALEHHVKKHYGQELDQKPISSTAPAAGNFRVFDATVTVSSRRRRNRCGFVAHDSVVSVTSEKIKKPKSKQVKQVKQRRFETKDPRDKQPQSREYLSTTDDSTDSD